MGVMYELDAIAAAVIGGTSLTGGIGTIPGTIIGALIIGVLNNGLIVKCLLLLATDFKGTHYCRLRY